MENFFFLCSANKLYERRQLHMRIQFLSKYSWGFDLKVLPRQRQSGRYRNTLYTFGQFLYFQYLEVLFY